MAELKTFKGLKRDDYLEWQDFYMATACLAAKRSTDPRYQVGACIVKKNKIVAVGYNGMHLFSPLSYFHREYRVSHAEMNAIANSNEEDVKGSTLYVGVLPCVLCTLKIINSGVKKVYYLCEGKVDPAKFMAIKRMFKFAGVVSTQYIPKKRKLELDIAVDPPAMATITLSK